MSVECPVCGMLVGDIAWHVDLAHAPQKPVYTCFCGKRCNSYQHLENHLMSMDLKVHYVQHVLAGKREPCE